MEIYEKLKRMEINENNSEFFVAVSDEIYREEVTKHDSIYPTEWFTDEEIGRFIDENFDKPDGNEIDCVLNEIYAEIPEALNYFSFPENWEKNGLSDKVRKLYNLSEQEFLFENERLFKWKNELLYDKM